MRLAVKAKNGREEGGIYIKMGFEQGGVLANDLCGRLGAQAFYISAIKSGLSLRLYQMSSIAFCLAA